MKKIKGQTAIQADAARPAKPAAPKAGARRIEPHVHVAAEGGPRKTDSMPKEGEASRANLKPAAPATKPERTSQEPTVYGDQQPRADHAVHAAAASARREQYVRMRVRVRDDRLTVVDSHLVDGPLGQAPGFTGSNVYEVTLDDRLLHAGPLPDLGLQRSFVNPDPKAPREQKGHHLAERPVYEFMARVPAGEITPDTIGRITIRLHRLKEEARADRLGAAPLQRQFEREVRPLAEVVGLPASVLPEAIEQRGGRTPSIG